MNRSKVLVRGNKRKFNRFNTSNGKTMQKEVGKGKTYIKSGKNKGIVVRGSYNAFPNKITYMSPGQQPFPPRYRTKITSSIYGSITGGAVSSGRYYVFLNSAYHPFAGGGWPNASPTIAAYNGAGYDQLCNNLLYDRCRVFGCKINIEFLPQALTDTVLCTVTPSLNLAIPATTSGALDERLTRQLLMSSSKMNSARGSNIKHYISQHKFLGVTSRAIQDDLSGNYIHAYNAPPSIPLYYVVNWATPDAVNTSAALEYKVTLTHYVEFFRNVNPAEND